MASADLWEHVFTPNDRLFFDANIWIGNIQAFIDDPRHWTVRSAARALKGAKVAQVFVDRLVISEVANRYLKNEWLAIAPDLSIKEFCQTEDFTESQRHIVAEIRRILTIATPIAPRHEKGVIDTLVNQWLQTTRQFNDHCISELCEEHRLTLVTNDADFAGSPVPILTANRDLL